MNIQETLSELRRTPGIKGCALVTPDGLMVAHSLEMRFRDDVVAGLTSFLLMTTARTLTDSGMGGMSHYTLHATNGRVVFMEIDKAWLVVLLDQFADLEGCRPEITGTVQSLRRLTRMT